jgi:hypothetical protein
MIFDVYHSDKRYVIIGILSINQNVKFIIIIFLPSDISKVFVFFALFTASILSISLVDSRLEFLKLQLLENLI